MHTEFWNGCFVFFFAQTMRENKLYLRKKKQTNKKSFHRVIILGNSNSQSERNTKKWRRKYSFIQSWYHYLWQEIINRVISTPPATRMTIVFAHFIIKKYSPIGISNLLGSIQKRSIMMMHLPNPHHWSIKNNKKERVFFLFFLFETFYSQRTTNSLHPTNSLK